MNKKQIPIQELEIIKQQFQAEVVKAMQEQGISIAQLSQATQVANRSIHNLINIIGNPNIVTIYKVCNILGLSFTINPQDKYIKICNACNFDNKVVVQTNDLTILNQLTPQEQKSMLLLIDKITTAHCSAKQRQDSSIIDNLLKLFQSLE